MINILNNNSDTMLDIYISHEKKNTHKYPQEVVFDEEQLNEKFSCSY